MTWGRYRRGRLRRSKFQRVREGTNLGRAGGTGPGPRAGIFRCESCRCSSSGARREQLRLLLDVKFVNPSLLDTPCLSRQDHYLPTCSDTDNADISHLYQASAVHQPCKHRTRKFSLPGLWVLWHFQTNKNLFSLQYGISGPYWYAGGATIQIIIFSILSIMLKTRAPGAKTFLQVRSYKERGRRIKIAILCENGGQTPLPSITWIDPLILEHSKHKHWKCPYDSNDINFLISSAKVLVPLLYEQEKYVSIF